MNQWTKVTDGLPETNDEYIVVLAFEELGKKKRSVTTGRYYDGIWFVGGERIFSITHWMSLPHPPGEPLQDILDDITKIKTKIDRMIVTRRDSDP